MQALDRNNPGTCAPQTSQWASLSCRAMSKMFLAPLCSNKLARLMPRFSAASWATRGMLRAVMPTS